MTSVNYGAHGWLGVIIVYAIILWFAYRIGQRQAAETTTDKRLMRGLFKAAPWLCLIMLIVLSWTPSTYMVRTGHGAWLEHATAYAGTAVLFRIAHPSLARSYLAAALVAYAGILETGQIWIPGRGASIFDWGAGSAGAVIASILWRRSLQIHVERRFWFYIGPDLFRGRPLMVCAGWGHKPDASPDEPRWLYTWECRLPG